MINNCRNFIYSFCFTFFGPELRTFEELKLRGAQPPLLQSYGLKPSYDKRVAAVIEATEVGIIRSGNKKH